MYVDYKDGDLVKMRTIGIVSHSCENFKNNNIFIVEDSTIFIANDIVVIRSINDNCCSCVACGLFFRNNEQVHISHLELVRTRLEINREIKLNELLNGE
jgi:hypothetical protein